MLPAAHRITDASGYRHVLRRGRRAASRTLVVSVLTGGSPGASRAGLVVSRSVGGSVVRNRVKRRLRHLLRARLATLPDGTAVVVRALPAAADASSARLARDLDRCLDRCLDQGPAPAPSDGSDGSDGSDRSDGRSA